MRGTLRYGIWSFVRRYGPPQGVGRIQPMSKILSAFSTSDWIAISAVIVAVVSFFVARKTLKDAEEFWKQQKWFDLYAKADEAYDTLEMYRTNYSVHEPPGSNVRHATDWNDLIFLVRRVHAMAMVFPKHSAIDKLVEATEFDEPATVYDESRRKLFSEAVEAMREMAVLDPSILEIRKRTRHS